jgi:hypothetical protein
MRLLLPRSVELTGTCLFCFREIPAESEWGDSVYASVAMKDIVEQLAVLPTPESMRGIDPAKYDFIEGMGCAECDAPDCEKCGEPIAHIDQEVNTFTGEVVHVSCLPY